MKESTIFLAIMIILVIIMIVAIGIIWWQKSKSKFSNYLDFAQTKDFYDKLNYMIQHQQKFDVWKNAGVYTQGCPKRSNYLNYFNWTCSP